MAVSTFSAVCRLAVLAIVIANLATSEAGGSPRLGGNTAFLIPIRAPRFNIPWFSFTDLFDFRRPPKSPRNPIVRRKSLSGGGLRPTSLLRSIGGISSVNNVMSTSESFSTDDSFDENEETTCVKGVCTTKKVKTVCKNGVCTNTPAGRALMRMLSGRAVEAAAAAKDEANAEDMAALMQELDAVLKKAPEDQQQAFAKEWQAITSGNVPEEQPAPAKTGRNLSLIRMVSGRAVEPQKVDVDALVKDMAALLERVPQDQQEAFEKAAWEASMDSNPDEQAPAKTGRSLFNGVIPVGQNVLLFV